MLSQQIFCQSVGWLNRAYPCKGEFSFFIECSNNRIIQFLPFYVLFSIRILGLQSPNTFLNVECFICWDNFIKFLPIKCSCIVWRKMASRQQKWSRIVLITGMQSSIVINHPLLPLSTIFFVDFAFSPTIVFL